MEGTLFNRVARILVLVFSLLCIRYIILLELIFSRNYTADYQLAYALPVCILIGFLALSISVLLWITKNK